MLTEQKKLITVITVQAYLHLCGEIIRRLYMNVTSTFIAVVGSLINYGR